MTISICFLTLSPEQEVAQAARHLAEQGAKYPMISAERNAYDRVVNAFEKEWNKHSTHKVAIILAIEINYREISTKFLGFKTVNNKSHNEQNAQYPTETQPRSRRDIDAVYIVANSAEITLIKPLLKLRSIQILFLQTVRKLSK